MKLLIAALLVIFFMSMYFCREGFAVRPPMPNFGTNTWKSAFDNSQQEFDKRYKAKYRIPSVTQ